MTRQILTPFDESWLEKKTGWLTGALSLMDTVEANTELVGLYPVTRQQVTQYYRFSITQTKIVQELPDRHIVHLQLHEARVYVRKGLPDDWVQTWGRYFDGLEPVWALESALERRRYTIGQNLQPTTQSRFFSKALKQLWTLHQRANAKSKLTGLLQKVKVTFEIDEPTITRTINKPFNASTQLMTTFLEELQQHFDPETGQAKANKPKRDVLAKLVTNFVILFQEACNVDEVSTLSRQVQADWIKQHVNEIYFPPGSTGVEEGVAETEETSK
jgi:hypothetical protein